MASDTWKECLAVLSNFLDEKAFTCLVEKHQSTPNSSELLKELLEVVFNTFPANYGAMFEDLREGVSSSIYSIALQIPMFFSFGTLFDVFKNSFQESLEAGKNVQSLKFICKFVSMVIKSSPLTWFLQVDENKIGNLEISHLEKPKESIVSVVLFLLKNIDLMSLSSEELKCHQKLELFPRILLLCHAILQKLCEDSEIPDILRNLESSVLRKVTGASVITCIQQTGKQHWVSEISRKVCFDFLDFVSRRCGCDGVEDLLSGSNAKIPKEAAEFQERKIFPNGLFGNILNKMKHFMTKDKLVDSDVAIHVLVWSVGNVKHPFLGRHLSMILTPLLLLVDDYRVHNRVTGIQVLEHVVDNINATELCWYGRAELIYEALHHRMYTNEPEVMQALHPCLLKILKVIEPSSRVGRKLNKCNINFQIILSSMEFESKIILRRAYCRHLVKFIDHMGIAVLCHLKHLMRVVFSYLEIPDVTTEEWRFAMLDVLKSIITSVWPRIPTYAIDILQCLMKLIIDISTSCSDDQLDAKQAMLVKIEECLLLLLLCCGEPVRKSLEEMTTGLGHTETEDLISRTLNSYKSQLAMISHVK